MKKVVILIGILLSSAVFAAPTATPDSSEEISMEELQTEFLKEADTLVVDEEDDTFLDQEIEKQKVVSEAPKNTPKTTVKAPASTPVKK